MILYLFLSLIIVYLGFQISLRDFKLLTGCYNYKIRFPQLISYFCLSIGVVIIFYDLYDKDYIVIMLSSLTSLIISFISEWLLSKLNPRAQLFSLLYRFCIIISFFSINYINFNSCYIPFLIYGLYLRNCYFGVVHGKSLLLYPLLSKNKFARLNKEKHIKASTIQLPLYNVIENNIIPDTNIDVLDRVQSLIDEIGASGGGILYFPRGRYLFNNNRIDKHFIQINYSNITIEGETDSKGNPLTEFVCCNSMPNQNKNPWLCPFFITTGESLQSSNRFWGLQFKNRKKIITQSNSLSDPGSDGEISEPSYATSIISNSQSGDSIIEVEDSSIIGKYILIGMYNTSSDGNLIKEILGVETIRPEWGTALRAGCESAPSFQYLTGVKRIIDKHRIELSHSLFRDIDMRYSPCIYNVEMLEDIHIKNLKISSKWNGLFHHHGFPLYYSVSQSREMDYEWNAINIKRVSNGSLSNIVINNFTNPLYLQDSYNVELRDIEVSGYDGHQGLKLYCHTSHCKMSDILFHNYYADMMGGEGNAYCNEFSHVRYVNQEFHPVDFDFHGFAEGPMSPPAYNVFSHIEGFRYIKGAGAIYNQPSLAQGNSWNHIKTSGELKGHSLFYALSYRPRSIISRHATALGTSLIGIIKTHRLNNIFKDYSNKLEELSHRAVPVNEHYKFFKGSKLYDIDTMSIIPNEIAETAK